MEPVFFAAPAEFRAWLERHHESEPELLVGFWKRGTGRTSITWPEAVDEALSFGWIDGVRRRIDEHAYSIRFTPRRATSTWSRVNVARVAELEAQGRMRPAGRRAFEQRSEQRTGIYSYEQEAEPELGEAYEAELRARPAAWDYFQARPPWYRRTATRWVVSAKREETRRRRLAQLVEDSAHGRHVPPLRWP